MNPNYLSQAKRAQLLHEFSEGRSVKIHLDARPPSVKVPAAFKIPGLVLEIGLNMAIPIPDLDAGEERLSMTLSFRREPFHCVVPWTVIYGMQNDEGHQYLWPDSAPRDVPKKVQSDPPQVTQAVRKGKPNLRIVR